MSTPPPPPPLPNQPAGALDLGEIDQAALREEKIEQAADQVVVLRDAVVQLEAKYLRVAHQIGRGMTGRAGSFDDVPEIDDMIRARSNLDHMALALECAEQALARLRGDP